MAAIEVSGMKGNSAQIMLAIARAEFFGTAGAGGGLEGDRTSGVSVITKINL
jgi:hypothetical protein